MIDCQEIYYKQKYIKSDREMELTRQAARMCDVMLEGMLAVLEPGMLETEVASWGYLIGRQIGAESFGFDVMVTSGEANRTLIGKALNRVIQEGDYVHLGVAPKCDGLTACERCTVVATLDPARISEDQKYWIRFVEGAYQVGLDAYRRVSAENLPAKLQEQALCDYFKAHEEEVCARLGKKIDFVRQKPYTGTHNGGYTECQEFSAPSPSIPRNPWAARSSPCWTWPCAASATSGTRWSSPAWTMCWWKRRWASMERVWTCLTSCRSTCKPMSAAWWSKERSERA